MEDTTSDIVKTTMDVPLSCGTVTITPFVVKHLELTKGPMQAIAKRIESEVRVKTAQFNRLRKEIEAVLSEAPDMAAALQRWLDAKETAVEDLACSAAVDEDAVGAAYEDLDRARQAAMVVVAAARGEPIPEIGVDINKLLMDSLPEARFLTAIACSKPAAWVDELGLDDLLCLAMAVIDINKERYADPKAVGPMAAFIQKLLHVGP